MLRGEVLAPAGALLCPRARVRAWGVHGWVRGDEWFGADKGMVRIIANKSG